MFFLLIMALGIGSLFAWTLELAGITSRPLRWAFAVLSSWPVFLALLLWLANRLFRRIDVGGNARQLLVSDDAAEAELNRPWQPGDGDAIQWPHNYHGTGQGGGGGALMFIIPLIFATAGIWLAWQFLRQSSTLLATTILDGPMVRNQPEIANRIVVGNWLRDAAAVSAIFFVFGAFIAALLAVVLGWIPWLA